MHITCQKYILLHCFALCILGISAQAKIKKNINSPLIPLNLFFGTPAIADVHLSPDGEQVSYLAPDNYRIPNIFVRDIAEKAHAQQISFLADYGITEHWWSYDQQKIFFLYDQNGSENTQLFGIDLKTKKSTLLTPYSDTQTNIITYSYLYPSQIIVQINKDNKELFDAYKLDTNTGEIKLLAKNPENFSSFFADEQLSIRGALRQQEDGGIELVKKTKNGTWERLVHWSFEDSLSTPLKFHRDDVYAFDSHGNNTLQLVKINIKTLEKTVLASRKNYDIAGVAFHPISTKPFCAISSDDSTYPFALDSDVQEDIAILNTMESPWVLVQTSQDFNTWLIALTTDTKPTSYYVYQRPNKKLSFLFDSQPALKKYHLMPTKRIQIRSRDGLTLHGYLTLPSGMQKPPFPLVILVHGGPQYADSWEYHPRTQFLANRGYAVLRVNFRGSTGYGKNFVNAANKEWGGKMQDDLVDAVRWAIKQKIADPKRIAIMGVSYGGYAALAGITFTPDTFCCAVDLFGFSTLETNEKNTAPYNYIFLNSFRQSMGEPKNDAELIRARSPLYHVKNITKPIFIASSLNDPICLPIDAQELIQELNRYNKKYEFLTFADEGHGTTQPKNTLKLYAAIEKFLAKYLGGRYEKKSIS